MADPLSVTASIIAVMGAAEGVGKALARIKNIRNAPSELLALINEVSDFRIVLGDVERNIRNAPRSQLSDDELTHLSDLVDRAKDQLLELDKLIQYRLVKSDGSQIKVSRREWARAEASISRFRDGLRDVRLNILIQMAVINSSYQLRIDLAIEEIYTFPSRVQATQHWSDVCPQLDDQSVLLHRILNDQSELRKLLQPRAAPGDGARIPGRIEADRQHPSNSIMGIRACVRNTHRLPCSRDCECACHDFRYFQSWKPLHNVLGRLFVGYSGYPRFRKCSESKCQARSAVYICVDYLFPSWFIANTIRLMLVGNGYGDIQMSLTSRRIVPIGAEVLRLASIDDVEGLQRLFTERLASPNDSSQIGYTAIHNAFTGHAWKSCKFLLEAGGNPHLKGFDSKPSPFARAQDAILLSSEDQCVLETLRTLFPDTDNYLEERDFSKLHMIVLGLSSENLEAQLVAFDGGVDAFDSENRTALMWAALKGDTLGVRLLLNAKADPNLYSHSGETPLHFASQSSSISCIKLLLKAGANPTCGTRFGSTALHFAGFHGGNRELIECLVTAGANPNGVDAFGRDPLACSIASDQAISGEALLDLGAGIALPNPDGKTPLEQAIWNKAYNMTKLLLRRGASYTSSSDSGSNVLHAAAEFGDLPITSILDAAVIRGIDPDAVTKDGKTALQIAQQRDVEPEGFVEQFRKMLAEIRERNAADAYSGITQDSSRGSSSESFWCLLAPLTALRRLQRQLGNAQPLQDCLHETLVRSIWLLVLFSWVVGFCCASLIYPAFGFGETKTNGR